MIGGLKQTTSRLAIAAAAGLFMGGIALTPAQAADLGGDCCADLEERVAELEATTVRKGNRKVSVKISGQVHRAIMFWDDGFDDNIFLTDQNDSSTRFRITGTATISPGRTAGFRMEYDLFGANSSDDVANCRAAGNCRVVPNADTAAFVNLANNSGVTSTNGNVGPEFDNRWQEIWIKDDKLGKVSLGKGATATESTSEVDLSGTAVTSIWSGADFSYTAFRFRNSATGAATAVTHGGAWNNFDGGGRQSRIRYDTPTLGGFTFSTSYAADDYVDGAVRFKKEWNSVRCAAAFGIGHDTRIDDHDIWRYNGSASCLHTPSGLNLTFASGTDDDSRRDGIVDADDAQFWYIKGGITRRWNSHGKTHIAVDYGVTENQLSSGTTDGESEIVGVALVQKIDSAAMELYLAYRHAEYDDNTATSYEELDFVLAGARIKF